MSRVAQREAELRAELEVVGDHARARRHLAQLLARRVGQLVPAGEVGRIPLLRRAARAHCGIDTAT